MCECRPCDERRARSVARSLESPGASPDHQHAGCQLDEASARDEDLIASPCAPCTAQGDTAGFAGWRTMKWAHEREDISLRAIGLSHRPQLADVVLLRGDTSKACSPRIKTRRAIPASSAPTLIHTFWRLPQVAPHQQTKSPLVHSRAFRLERVPKRLMISRQGASFRGDSVFHIALRSDPHLHARALLSS